MPQVPTGPNLKFTNHWIGIYGSHENRLLPSKRIVKDLQPVPGKAEAGSGFIVPADLSTLIPVYEKAIAERERQSGPESRAVAQAAFNLGRFLLQIERDAEAETPLRRALAIDERTSDARIDADRESLALSLKAQGKLTEAVAFFRQAAAGSTLQVSARAFAELAAHDSEHADDHYRNAAVAEEKASGSGSPRVALFLHQYALALRSRHQDADAEPVLRRALSIQQAAPSADAQVTVGILDSLGNLLEGRGQLDEAEKFQRTALVIAESKFGPESPQLAVACTNLADTLWNKKNLREAGLLYRRAIVADAFVYGPERPETAADIANLGMLMNDAGQSIAGVTLLKQALAIYEKTLGASSDEAKFVRENLSRIEH